MRIEINENTIIEMKPFGQDELAYWEQFGINQTLLTRFKVHLVHSYQTVKKDGATYNIEATNNSPIFAYEASKQAFKLYVPFAERRESKFRWLGTKPGNYIFGYSQLPPSGDVVILAAGEKDALTLNSLGYPAISLNSETARVSEGLLAALRAKFKHVCCLFDTDITGIKTAKKLEKELQLQALYIPPFDKPGEPGSPGKDISEYVHAREPLDWLKDAIKSLPEHKIRKKEDSGVEKLLKIQVRLRAKTKEEIKFQRPIIKHLGTPLIYPNTIVSVQGQTGTHKSRLVETIGSAILKKESCQKLLLGFEAIEQNDFGLIYIDTERNWQDQFPYALQQIKLKAGYSLEEDPPNFWYTSLIEVSRGKRKEVLEEFIKHITIQNPDLHYIIVLDVVTDCVLDFNRSDESMEFIQTLNRLINQQNLTFICLIHENPGSSHGKARGHLGSEIGNKASTLIQIGFEKDAQQNPTELVRIKLLKFRQGKRPEPIYAKYDEQEKGLVMADPELIQQAKMARMKKADPGTVAEYIQDVIGNGRLTKGNIYQYIQNQFNCSERTARDRLKEIVGNEKYRMRNMDNELCLLQMAREGNHSMLFLEEIDHDNPQ